MAVPNEYQFVVDHVGPRLGIVGDEEETRANSFWAVNDACNEIRQKDQHWGLLVKTGGAQVEERAADIWLYDLGNGTAQVVDVVSNAEGAPPPEGGARTAPAPSWGEKDIRNVSEWTAPYPSSEGGGGESGGGESGGVTEEDLAALQAEVNALTDQVHAQQTTINDLTTRLTAVEAKAAEPLHCHGPVDLPIVFESWNSLRARGDIDVAVKPGEATPPPPGDNLSFADVVMLKRILARIRDDGTTEPPPAS